MRDTGPEVLEMRGWCPYGDLVWLHTEELAIVAVVLAALLAVAIRWLVKVGSARH